MLTCTVSVAVALPPVLVAVTVYVPEEVMAVGVPLIAPVVLLKLSPAGRDGEIDQFVGAPPPVVGETVDMVVPLTNVSELGEYVTADGARSLTTMVTLAVSVPPVLVAVIVYEAEEVIAVGVPEIAPVEVSKAKPAGSDGDTA